MDFCQLPSWDQWKKMGVRSRHGINIPLASLRTHKSAGIGEFYDLIPLIDWCHEVGFEVIQLLPLNDSGNDLSPYNALSSCALHPLYLSLGPLSPLLNSLPRISYQEVLALKLSYLQHDFKTSTHKLTQHPRFQDFVSKRRWLVPYALFKVLKEKFHHFSWMSWPEELKHPEFKKLAAEYEEKMQFYLVLQYLCHLQLTEVKEYARSKGILLKGDLPLLVSKDSADAWHQPDLFDFTDSVGAPPDQYNPEGQSWGFPLFKWEAQNFSWWKEKLQTASDYYDLYRIDHVVGLFRIWAIPSDKTPKEGRFLPQNPDLWIPQGKEALHMMLKSSSMLPIAEDLGTVPRDVRTTLAELGICGTKVIRWEREYDQGGNFIPFDRYPLLSMTTVSTHDSETLALWWQNSREEAKAFCKFQGWSDSPHLSFEKRLALLRAAHHTSSLFHINLLPEYLALFPELVAPDPSDERINIPGKILSTNWTYRLHRPLEEITSHLPLKKAIASLLS